MWGMDVDVFRQACIDSGIPTSNKPKEELVAALLLHRNAKAAPPPSPKDPPPAKAPETMYEEKYCALCLNSLILKIK